MVMHAERVQFQTIQFYSSFDFTMHVVDYNGSTTLSNQKLMTISNTNFKIDK